MTYFVSTALTDKTSKYKLILDSISPTPLVPLKSINPNLSAKLEYFNPSGSLKWRPAVYMIAKAAERGDLDGFKIIIEPTSGQMGLALAELGKLLGHEVEIVVPRAVSEETKEILRKKAHLLEVDDDLCPRIGRDKKGKLKKVEKARSPRISEETDDLIPATRTDQAIGLVDSILQGEENRRARGLEAKKYFRPDQYNNMDNVLAHYKTTAPEIWAQTYGNFNFFAAGAGTGGTVSGNGLFFKEKNPEIKIIAVTPVEEDHVLQGLRNLKVSMMPSILEKNIDVVDEWIEVTNKDALDMVGRIAREEGYYVGPSSGAVLWAADRFQKENYGENDKNGKGVVIFGDGGERYRQLYLFRGVFTAEEIEGYETNLLKISKLKRRR